MNYLTVLRRLHEILKPQTYFEIGVNKGASLELSTARVSIGVDPNPRPQAVRLLERPGVSLFHETSDEFFLAHEISSVLDNARLDLAFIDGLHEYAQVLRDFTHVEQWSSPCSTIVLHDVLPPTERAASRAQVSGQSCGDVWQIVSCLQKHRPDLKCFLIDAPPAGLLIVRSLDPANQTLTSNMEEILGSVPEDGVQYEAAVLDYMATVSAQAPEDVLSLLKASVQVTKQESVSANRGEFHTAGKVRLAKDGPSPSRRENQSRPRELPGSVVPGLVESLASHADVIKIGPDTKPAIRPLDPEQFSFVGFDDNLAKIERSVRSVGIRSGVREVTIVENALILPPPVPTGRTTKSRAVFLTRLVGTFLPPA